MTKPIPTGYHSVTPNFVVKDARKAMAFYQKAFGAKEHFAMPGPDGKGVMHAELEIGNSFIMLGEENPQMGNKSAETLGGSPISLFLYVDDVDAFFPKAVAAGATVLSPVQDMFWGDRAGTIKDPFGYSWMIGTRKKDLTPEEIGKNAAAFFAQAKK